MFSDLADHAPVALFLMSENGRLTYHNKAWTRITGMSWHEGSEDSWLKFIHPDDQEKVSLAWHQALEAKSEFRAQMRFFKPDGDMAWVEVKVCPTDEGFIGSGTCITEQKQVESMLRLYKAIFSTSPDFAYIFGTDHRIIYANKSLLTMWGRTWEETEGKTWLELGYEAWHAEMHDRELDLVIRIKRQWRAEIPFTGAHGRRNYEYIFMPVLGADGEVEAVAGTTRDVTERKQRELRASLLSELAEKLAPLGTEREILKVTVEMVGRHLNVHRCHFMEYRKTDQVVRCGPNWVRDGGLGIEGNFLMSDFGGEAWWERYLTADPVAAADLPPFSEKEGLYGREGDRSFIARSFRGLSQWKVLLAVTDDRERMWMPEEIDLLDNVLARVWPRVEQARSLESIRQNQQRLALVAEAGRVILEADAMTTMLERICHMAGQHLQCDVCLAFLNRDPGSEAEVTFGFGLDKERASQVADIYFKDNEQSTGLTHGWLSQADEKALALLTTHGVTAYASYPLIVGEEFLGLMVFASRFRVNFSTPELEFLATLSQYITAAYVRLRLLDNLRESDKRKDHFLATLAHELRNPLAPIRTGLEIIKKSDGDRSKVAQVTGILERQTIQMVHLIDDLLDLSRVNTGKIILKKEVVSLKAVLEIAVEASQPLFQEREHRLELFLPADAVMVEVDPSRLAQIVSNLLSNAAKYTPLGGRIQLTSAVDAQNVWVKVTDNGLGIQPSEQQSIFELFQQTANGSADGLGIGLTLVKSLVEMHGGTVRVASEGVGKGSEFTIKLEGCVVAADEPAEEPVEAVAAIFRKRVLVVDDGKSAADMLAMFFQMEGMEVEVAYDGKQGLEKALSFLPDLVVMDIGMPIMDGLEAARAMREKNIRAKLVALSGWGRDEDKQRTSEAGFDEHMIKPICPDDLRAIMAKYFGS